MKYLLLMTFSGSGLLIGYLCWERLLGKSLTQRMKYRALMMVMLVYVMPWAWLREGYRSIFGLIWRMGAIAAAKGVVNVADIKTDDSVYQTEEYQLWMLVLAIWFVIAIVIMLIRIARYMVKRNALHALAIKCGDKNLQKIMTCVRESGRYTCKPEVVWTRVDNETFTLGIIKPVIFLQKKYAEKELYWILKHEMAHIARKDLWIKLFLEFVCCLHWLNPFIYLLEQKVRFLCETSCDECVVKGCTEEECKKYIELLEENKGRNKLKIPFSSTLTDGDEEIDKRILLLKERRNIKCKEKVIAICVFALLVFLDSLTALAYPKVYHVKNAAIEAAEDAVGGGNFWINDCAKDGYGTFSDTILYDEQFVGEDGKIYPANFCNETEVCSLHVEMLGVVQVHIKDGTAGYMIEIYEASRCAKCGMVWTGEVLYKVRKDLCIHQAASEE